ncbi:unnamed protein product, partial [Menidia menidia]
PERSPVAFRLSPKLETRRTLTGRTTNLPIFPFLSRPPSIVFALFLPWSFFFFLVLVFLFFILSDEDLTRKHDRIAGLPDMSWQDGWKEPPRVTDPHEPVFSGEDSGGDFAPSLAVCTFPLPPLRSSVYMQSSTPDWGAVQQLRQRMAHNDNPKHHSTASEFARAQSAGRRAPLISHPVFPACASLPLEVTEQDLRLVNKSTKRWNCQQMSSYFVNSFCGRYPNGADFQLHNYGDHSTANEQYRDSTAIHSSRYGYGYNGMDLTVGRTGGGHFVGSERTPGYSPSHSATTAPSVEAVRYGQSAGGAGNASLSPPPDPLPCSSVASSSPAADPQPQHRGAVKNSMGSPCPSSNGGTLLLSRDCASKAPSLEEEKPAGSTPSTPQNTSDSTQPQIYPWMRKLHISHDRKNHPESGQIGSLAINGSKCYLTGTDLLYCSGFLFVDRTLSRMRTTSLGALLKWTVWISFKRSCCLSEEHGYSESTEIWKGNRSWT